MITKFIGAYDECVLKLFVVCLLSSFSSNHSARRGHLCVSHRTHRGPCHHGSASAGGRGRGRFLLADGLQENAERQRSTAASYPSAESDVHES